MPFSRKWGGASGKLSKKAKKTKTSNTFPTPAGTSGDAIIPRNIHPSAAAAATTSGDANPTTLTTPVTRKAPPSTSTSTSTDLEAQVDIDDENINTRDLGCLDKAKLKRMTIAYIYAEHFNSVSKTGWGKIENWEGKNGAVAGIINMFPSKEKLEPSTLDNSLNQDVHTAVQSHCILTQNLEDEDKEKFSMRTPAVGLKAYTRIWEFYPPTHRVIQDINLTYTSLKQVLENKGALLVSEYTRTGNRLVERGKHGGRRQKETDEERIEKESQRFVHPQAESSVQSFGKTAKLKVEKKIN